MKLRTLFFLASIMLLAPLLIFAQDSTAVSGLGGITSKIPEWVIPTVLGLYELLVRVVPTSKNWSILSLVINVIKWVFPNKSTEKLQVTNLTSGQSYVSNSHEPSKP